MMEELKACPYCKDYESVGFEGKDGNLQMFNFCPVCGSPLTTTGRKILAGRRVEPEKVKELYYEYQKLQRWQKHSANEWCKGYGSGIRRALIVLGLNKEAKADGRTENHPRTGN